MTSPWRHRIAGAFLFVGASLSALSCSDDPTGPGAGSPVSLVAVGGALPPAEVGEILGQPVTVSVQDARGRPVADVQVQWLVAAGGGSASPATDATDSDGLARTQWRLGPPAGEQRLVARVAGLADLGFTVQAAAGPAERLAFAVEDLTLVLEPGRDEVRVVVLHVDRFGNPTAGGAVTWSASDERVATVDGEGSVRAVSAGSAEIRARAGAMLATLALVVENPVPVVEELAPSSWPLGSAGLPLRVRGSRFVPGSVVLWDGEPRPTTFVDGGTLEAAISAADLAVEGAVRVGVLNPTPGGGTASGLDFEVERVWPALRVTPYAPTVGIDQWLDVGVVAFDAAGSPVSSPDVEWSILDDGLEAWLEGGDGVRARGRAVGVARLSARWEGVSDTLVVDVRGIAARLRSVVAGTTLSCGLDDAGAAYCWGWHYRGLSPDGQYSYSSFTAAPAAVPGGRRFTSLTVGSWHACGLDETGAAWCWYDDLYGQLGHGVGGFPRGRSEPTAVAGGLRFVQLAAGGWHTCGVTTVGQVWCWGANGYGQLGDGTQRDSSVPVRVAGGQGFSRVFANGWHTCGLTPAGVAHCWGFNGYGQLGREDEGLCDDVLNGPVPCGFTPVPVDTELRFTDLAVGGMFTCGLVASGEAWCWGAGARGQLGNGDVRDSPVPVRVGGSRTFAAVDAGFGHACGLTPSGEAYCWGQNDYGNNGVHPGAGDACVENNTLYYCNVLPVAVVGATFSSLDTGLYHTCGTTSQERVYCWGEGDDGRLGRGRPEGGVEPVPGPVWDGWMTGTPTPAPGGPSVGHTVEAGALRGGPSTVPGAATSFSSEGRSPAPEA